MTEASFPRGSLTLHHKRRKTTNDEGNKGGRDSGRVKNDRHRQRKGSEGGGPRKEEGGDRGRGGDFLFGGHQQREPPTSSSSRKRQKRSGGDGGEGGSTTVVTPVARGGGAVLPADEKRAAYIESVGFARIDEAKNGTFKLLGVIRELSEEYCVFSLPNMLTGFVRRGERDPPLTESLGYFHAHQPALAVTVTKTATDEDGRGGNRPRRRIELSFHPRHVNAGLSADQLTPRSSSSGGAAGTRIRGVVSSLQDHGCIVNLGIRGVTAFLPYENVGPRGSGRDRGDSGGGDNSEVKDDQRHLGSVNDSDSDSDGGSDDEDGGDVNVDGGGSDGGGGGVGGGGGGDRPDLRPGTVADFVVVDCSSAAGRTTVRLSLPSAGVASRFVSTTDVVAALSAPPRTVQSLQPGMLVRCRVDGYARNGLLVSFGTGGVFQGAIDLNHLGGLYEGGEIHWRTVMKSAFGRTVPRVTARIIAVDPASKIIRLSLLPHLLSQQRPNQSELPPVGTVVSDATVLRVDKGFGALLAIPPVYVDVEGETTEEDGGDEEKDGGRHEREENGKKRRRRDSADGRGGANDLMTVPDHVAATKVRAVYVHISKAFDDEGNGAKGKKRPAGYNPRVTMEAEFSKLFRVGSKIRSVRIVSTNSLVDNVASGSTAPSVVDAAVLTHGDLKPGAVYRNVPIVATGDYGVLVSLGDGVRAMCTNLHLFDKSTFATMDDAKSSKRYRRLFEVGKKIDVRCLTINPSSKRCNVTHKPSLVKDEGPTVASYDHLPGPNEIVRGFVTKSTTTGIVVTFYDNVHGYCSAKDLARDLGVEDPRTNYRLGDVVKCRIIRAERRGGRTFLTLSLNISAVHRDGGEEESHEPTSMDENESLAAGNKLPGGSGKVVQMVESEVQSRGKRFPGYAVVSYRMKGRRHLDGEDESSGSSTSVVKSFECRLPFEHILDSYGHLDVPMDMLPQALDEVAREHLKVGKKLSHDAVVMTLHPRTSSDMPVITIKPKLVEAAERIADGGDGTGTTDTTNHQSVSLLPSSARTLFVGARAIGYVAHIDQRYGAFVRFLDDLTGIIPKLKKGLDMPLFGTIQCKVMALEASSSPPKILLRKDKSSGKATKLLPPIKVGDDVGEVEVETVSFHRATVRLLDEKYRNSKIRARIHVTVAAEQHGAPKKVKRGSKHEDGHPFSKEGRLEGDLNADIPITKYHPFFKWKKGKKIEKVRCVAMEVKGSVAYVELSNMEFPKGECGFVESEKELKPAQKVSGIVQSVGRRNQGIRLQLSPGVQGFIPGLELSDKADVLNEMASYFPLGTRIKCLVIQCGPDGKSTEKGNERNRPHVILSALLRETGEKRTKACKPVKGDLVVGRINQRIAPKRAPAMMLNLRAGYTGRCCITELKEVDDWENMPLGKAGGFDNKEGGEEENIRTAEEDDEFELDDIDDEETDGPSLSSDFPHGKYAECRVLKGTKGSPVLEVSLRESRLEGDFDDDEAPEVNEIVSAYVVDTNPKGCFLRFSRTTVGRVILKELSDSFVPEPTRMFPQGRLVIGKVKKVSNIENAGKQTTVDLDMRESSLLGQNKLSLEDIKEGSKHKGVVTRIEKYGVFVKLDDSDISGLAHMSECSDKYISVLEDFYNPGDLVKVVVLKVDGQRISLGLKASYFEGDVDTDSEDESEEDSEDESSIVTSDDDGSTSDASSSDERIEVAPQGNKKHDKYDSDDEELAPKVAEKLPTSQGNKHSESERDSDSDDEVDSSDSSDSEHADEGQSAAIMDTNVGFDWDLAGKDRGTSGADVMDTDSSDEDESDDAASDSEDRHRTSHKARKKAAKKRKDEQEISKRESALADGTADENPETAKDFERLLASEPNSSEHWIRYMAYFLSTADIDGARNVANRAFDRIEFRQEGEKLNVWTALLTLEMKYGSPSSLDDTIGRACNQNNPKQVYLRVCELFEKEVDAIGASGSVGYAEAAERADEMFTKMCKKFKSKKTVWLAHLKYLLKGQRHEEAHSLLKRSVKSLPEHKHVETMAKFAQLEFEYGSLERGRTIFDALLQKHPKRLDLLFVYVDKEVKAGEIGVARDLFRRVIHPPPGRKSMKLSDKQMKSLFKKWFRIEENHGDVGTQEDVKAEARAYVDRSTGPVE